MDTARVMRESKPAAPSSKARGLGERSWVGFELGGVTHLLATPSNAEALPGFEAAETHWALSLQANAGFRIHHNLE